MAKQVKNLDAIKRRMQKNKMGGKCICKGKGCKNCQGSSGGGQDNAGGNVPPQFGGSPNKGGGQPNSGGSSVAKKGNKPPWLQ